MIRPPAVVEVALLERLAWLDLSGVQQRFVRGGGAELTNDMVSRLSLEYRRFLFLRMIHPYLDIAAPPLIDAYWRSHADDRIAFNADCAGLASATTDRVVDRLVPPSETANGTADPTICKLYAATFPCGNAELWGWPELTPGHRYSVPGLGSVHRRLPGAIDDISSARLLIEARERRTTTTEEHSDEYYTTGRGVVESPWRLRSASPGPVLLDMHWSGTIPRLIASATGVLVVPTAASYLYYSSGGSVGIHTDGYGVELALLTLLSGAVEPLHCHLRLVDTPLEEIKTLAETTGGLPEGGTPFDINTEPFLLSGQRIPHQRGPQDRDQETVILFQGYAVLVP